MQGIVDSFNYLSKMSDVNMTITGFVPFCGDIFGSFLTAPFFWHKKDSTYLVRQLDRLDVREKR